MARLDQLDIVSRKILAGKMKGERRSKRRGQSVEFADFRNYVVGDDLRFIDWNIYARLDKLFLKLFLEEEDLALYVLIDTSKSMDYGDPNKSLYAKQVAAALAYIGLVNYNRVNVIAMADKIVAETGAMRGRRRVTQMIDFISKLQPQGPSHFAEGCKRFALSHRQKGVCVVLSDFLRQGRLRERPALRRRRKVRPVLRADAQPAGDRARPSGRPEAPRHRRRRHGRGQHHAAADQAVQGEPERVLPEPEGLRHARGATYLFTSTAVPFDTLVLNYLRERGLLG
jgi:uncharacterized protein (DUF58 family)